MKPIILRLDTVFLSTALGKSVSAVGITVNKATHERSTSQMYRINW